MEAIRGAQAGAIAIGGGLQGRRDAAYELLSSMRGVTLSRPNATFYLFPDVTDAMAAKGIATLPEFAERALKETGVSFCTRLHFGRPQPGEDRMYARFAYSGLPESDIREGLGILKQWIEA